MTGRTHDLAAFTAVTFIIATQPLPHMSLATGLVALGGNMLGGIAPDIDQSTGVFWHRIPAGSLIGKLLAPLLGGHRYVSHSILGLGLFGFLLYWLLKAVHSVLLVDMNIVWWSFMIGFLSHLVIDTITREGVPWLFPIPIRFAFPPFFRFLRVRTGGIMETAIIFPGLLIINGYLIYTYYHVYLSFFHNLIN